MARKQVIDALNKSLMPEEPVAEVAEVKLPEAGVQTTKPEVQKTTPSAYIVPEPALPAVKPAETAEAKQPTMAELYAKLNPNPEETPEQQKKNAKRELFARSMATIADFVNAGMGIWAGSNGVVIKPESASKAVDERYAKLREAQKKRVADWKDGYLKAYEKAMTDAWEKKKYEQTNKKYDLDERRVQIAEAREERQSRENKAAAELRQAQFDHTVTKDDKAYQLALDKYKTAVANANRDYEIKVSRLTETNRHNVASENKPDKIARAMNIKKKMKWTEDHYRKELEHFPTLDAFISAYE